MDDHTLSKKSQYAEKVLIQTFSWEKRKMVSLDVGQLAPKPPAPFPEEKIKEEWSKNEKDPLVSIFCIVYNHSSFLEDCLNGFLMQKTRFPFEIIIHDDASTDGSQKIIERYKKKYPSIIKCIFEKENQYSKGKKAFSFFENVSDAPFIAICEGDDFWLDEGKLQKQVEFLENNKSYVICGHDAMVIDDSGKILKKSKLRDNQKRDFVGADISRGRVSMPTMSWVYRNIIKEFAPERSMVRNEDNFLMSLLGKYGKSHYHADIKPAAYRVHSGGVWSSASERARQDDALNTCFWMYRYYHRVGEKSLSRFYHDSFMRTIIIRIEVRSIISGLARRLLRCVFGKKFLKAMRKK